MYYSHSVRSRLSRASEQKMPKETNRTLPGLELGQVSKENGGHSVIGSENVGDCSGVWRKGRWIDQVETGRARERPMSE